MHDIHNYNSQENNLHRSTLISMKKNDSLFFVRTYTQILMRMLMLDLVDSTIDFFYYYYISDRIVYDEDKGQLERRVNMTHNRNDLSMRVYVNRVILNHENTQDGKRFPSKTMRAEIN